MHLGKTNDNEVDLWFYTKAQKGGSKEFQVIVTEDNTSLVDYGNASSVNFDTYIDFGHAQPLDTKLSNFKIEIYNISNTLLGTYYTNSKGKAKVIAPFGSWKWKVEKLGYEGFELLQIELNKNVIYKIVNLNYILNYPHN